MINPNRKDDQHGSRIQHRRSPVLRPAQQSLVVRGRTKIAKPKSRYEELKETVRAWLEDRFAIAAALKEIRDDKLYKKEYGTFEDFCHDEYGMTRSYAYRLIEAEESVASVRMSPLSTKISNVSQARALAAAPKEVRVEVLESVASSGPVTAKRIDAEVSTRKGNSKSKVIDVEPSYPANHRGKPNQLSPNPDSSVMDEPETRVHDCPMCRCAKNGRTKQ